MIKSPTSISSTMSLLLSPLTQPSSILCNKTSLSLRHNPQLHSISITIAAIRKRHTLAPSICFSSSSSSSSSYYSFNESSKKSNSEAASQPEDDEEVSDSKPNTIVDEWGEKSEPEPETLNKFSGPDPPADDEANDEWGGVGVKDDGFGNGTPGAGDDVGESEKLRDLKRAFVDTVYGTGFGFRASTEVRAEAIELISQLEAKNPTPAPTETPELLDGNWVLV